MIGSDAPGAQRQTKYKQRAVSLREIPPLSRRVASNVENIVHHAHHGSQEQGLGGVAEAEELDVLLLEDTSRSAEGHPQVQDARCKDLHGGVDVGKARRVET